MSQPEVLNKAFEIVSYDGGVEKNNAKYKIDNILKFSALPHCSEQGQNFVVTMEYAGESVFTLTNFAIRGGENCSSPVKSGLLFVSNSKIDPKSIEKYKGFTKEQFDALTHQSEEEPVLFFETSESNGEFQSQVWKSGKFAAILFIDSWNEGNIDVQHVVFYGFHGKHDIVENWGDIDESLGVTFPSFKYFNPLYDEYAKQFMIKNNVVIFSNTSDELDVVEKIAKQHANDFNFFYSPFHIHSDHCSHHQHGPGCHHDHDHEEEEEEEEEDDEDEPNITELSQLLVNMIGLKKFPALVMFSGDMKTKCVLDKNLTKEGIETFMSDFTKGNIPNFVKTGTRYPNDVLEEFPNAKQVMASFWNDVKATNKDVFMVFHGQYDVKREDVVNGIFDSLKNTSIYCGMYDVVDNEFIVPIRVSPTFVFFQKGKYDTPIQYSKKFSGSEILTFVKENASEPIDGIDNEIAKFTSEESFEKLVALSYKYAEKLKEFVVKNAPDEELKKKMDIAMEGLLGSYESKAIKEIEAKFDDLKGISHDFVESCESKMRMAEKETLKNIVKIHSSQEYYDQLSKAGKKLVVVDWFAEWCGPCKQIAPHFAQFSVDYNDVVFLKVDVDQVSDLAKIAGIEAMPTFHFIKEANVVESMRGANLKGLKDLIDKLK